MSLQPSNALTIQTGRILSRVARALLAEAYESFALEQSPDGEKWTENQSGLSPIGQRTGRLVSSLAQEVAGNRVEISASAPYAQYFNSRRRFLPSPERAETAVARALREQT